MAGKLKEVFYQSQHKITSHEKLSKQLLQIYEKMPLNDFVNEFTNCLKVPFVHGEKHRVVENTLRFAATFIASFLLAKPASAQDEENEEEEEELCPFVSQVLKFLFENHNSENQAIRFRVCQFINKVLNNLGNEACLDDSICDQICECMMDRLQDKAPVVRMQAVLALHRLQDPSDVNCPVMKAFMFHMATDPNADVRRAIITNIAVTTSSIRSILERTHDVKDLVRRTAYQTLSKLGVQRFTISQRVRLLTDGLKDHSAIVRDCVSKIMLPSWLQYFKGSFQSFLHALDCENSTEISSLALQTLFKSESMKDIIEQLTTTLNEDKVIPVDQLNPDNVLYWRILSEYLDAHPEIANDCPIEEPLPEILPELTTFCNYIKQFFEDKCTEEAEHWVKLQHQYILIQLLELCKGFDLADEMGRTNLRNLCLFLLTNNNATEDVVPVVVEVMIRVIPDVEDRLQALAEAISEVREPMTEQEPEPGPSSHLTEEEVRQRELKQASLKVKINELEEEKDEAIRDQDFIRAQKLKEEYQKLQQQLKALFESPSSSSAVPRVEVRDPVKDREALCKCLRIVREMVQSDSVKCLSATLRSIMQNFVLPCLQEDNTPIIRNKALEVLGLFALLDKTLAQENFVMFCFQIASDEVCEVALKVTFDLLHLYGLETFQIQENYDTSTKKKSKKKNLFVTEMYDDEFDTEEEESQESQTDTSSGSSRNTSNLISMLTSLLDSASVSMRNLAMEGLYKLLAACRITSSALLSRLVLMWYSPVTEGDETLRQPLGVFLTVYASHCPRSQETLEQAFLPTLRTLMQAPVTSPLTQIDQESVARLFISLTRPGINKFHSKTSHIHNNMAISICNEVMDCDDTTNIAVLLRALSQLELSLEDAVFREELKNLTTMVSEIFRTSKEKLFLRTIEKFSLMLENALDNATMQTAEVDNTAATSQMGETRSLITNNSARDTTDEHSHARSKNAKLLHPHMHSLISLNEMERGNDEDDDDDDDSQPTSTVMSNIVIPASPPRSQSSDEESGDNVLEESNYRSSSSDGPPRKTRATNEDNVFKLPLDPKIANVKKTRNHKARGNSKTPSESDADTSSPAPKRRKTGKDYKESHSNEGIQATEQKSKAVKSKNTEKEIPPGQGTKTKGKDKNTSKSGTVKDNPKSAKNMNTEEGSELPQSAYSKRHIHPTEKGSTLKTFQKILSPGAQNSKAESLSSPRTLSNKSDSGSSPQKNSTLHTRGQDSEEYITSSVIESSASSSSSPMKTPIWKKTSKSESSDTDKQSFESPPSSAAQLKKKMAKGISKTQKQPLQAENVSDCSLPPSPARGSPGRLTRHRLETVNALAQKRPARVLKSSSSGVDTDSIPSPVSPKGRQHSQDVLCHPSKKKLASSQKTSGSEVDSDGSPLPLTRSQRNRKRETPPAEACSSKQHTKTSNLESPSTNADSPVHVRKEGRVKVRNDSSPQKPKRMGTLSSMSASSDIDSDASPVISRGRTKVNTTFDSDASPSPATRRVRSHVEGITRLTVKPSENKQMRATRHGISKPDAFSSPHQNVLKSNVLDIDSPGEGSMTSCNEDSPIVSAAKLKQILKKKVPKTHLLRSNAGGKSTDSDTSPSPSRRSSSRFGNASPEVEKQTSKKRLAHVLKLPRPGPKPDSSPSGRHYGQEKSSESDSPSSQPIKKIRTKTSNSPLRRSLRSVTTPSPKTRSGKVKV